MNDFSKRQMKWLGLYIKFNHRTIDMQSVFIYCQSCGGGLCLYWSKSQLGIIDNCSTFKHQSVFGTIIGWKHWLTKQLMLCYIKHQ